jgi:hypothetical protein
MTAKLFSTTLLFVLTASWLPGAESPPTPKRFKASIGGFLGGSYVVEWRDGTLTYTESGRGQAAPKPVVITPTAAQWREFRQALDDLKVWDWQPKYPNDKVADGTKWSLDIAYPDRELKTEGANNYPDPAGKPNGNPTPTEHFKRYLAAVKKLTGGKTFQ